MEVRVPATAPDDDVACDSVQSREDAYFASSAAAFGGDAPALDWQPELDSALDAIDSCLPVKRRRASDPPGTSYPRPEVSVLTFTPEVLDALATRVAEKLTAQLPAPRVPAPEPPSMKPGAVMSIRYRWPLFSRRVKAQA